MAKDAILQGDYTDLKFIKSRKVAVIFIEIPIENASSFVEAFGTPNPATGVPVALARLQSQPEAVPKAEKPERKWSDMPRSQQAGITCEDPGFAEFIRQSAATSDTARMSPADRVRRWCGIQSRADLDRDPIAADKWDRLYSDYQLWRRGAAA